MLCFLQEAHIAKLQGNLDASGDASLQNAMDMATESLKSIPPYGHREARFNQPLSLHKIIHPTRTVNMGRCSIELAVSQSH